MPRLRRGILIADAIYGRIGLELKQFISKALEIIFHELHSSNSAILKAEVNCQQFRNLEWSENCFLSRNSNSETQQFLETQQSALKPCAPVSKIEKMKVFVIRWREKFDFAVSDAAKTKNCRLSSAILAFWLFVWRISESNLSIVRKRKKRNEEVVIETNIPPLSEAAARDRPGKKKREEKCANNRRMNLPLLKYNFLSLDQCSLWSGVIWICFSGNRA